MHPQVAAEPGHRSQRQVHQQAFGDHDRARVAGEAGRPDTLQCAGQALRCQVGGVQRQPRRANAARPQSRRPHGDRSGAVNFKHPQRWMPDGHAGPQRVEPRAKHQQLPRTGRHFALHPAPYASLAPGVVGSDARHHGELRQPQERASGCRPGQAQQSCARCAAAVQARVGQARAQAVVCFAAGCEDFGRGDQHRGGSPLRCAHAGGRPNRRQWWRYQSLHQRPAGSKARLARRNSRNRGCAASTCSRVAQRW